MSQEKSQLKSGVILSYINMLLGNLIPVFYTPVMLSLLGQEEYGLYKLAGSLISYLSLLSFGIGSAVTRFLIQSRLEQGREAEKRMLGLFLLIFRIIALVALIAGTIVTWNLDLVYKSALSYEELRKMKLLMFLMVCNTALSLAQTPYVSAITAHERFIFLQSANIFTTCLGPLLNLVMLMLGFGSVGMVTCSLAITLLCRILYSLYVRHSMDIKPCYQGIPIHRLREILKFSFWVFLSNVVAQLYNATDTVLIGAIPSLSTTGVAVYSVGSTFNSIVLSVTVGLSSLMTPKVNKMVFSGASNEELTDLSIRVGRLQAYVIALIVSGFVIFGRPFLHFYAGDGYQDAYWVAVFMMIPNMVPLVQSVCLSIIIAQNKHKFRSLVYLAIAVLNVIGTWYLIQTMGINGAALATGISLLLGQGLVMNWYYHYKTGLNMCRFWKEVGIVYRIPALLCAAALLLGNAVNLYTLRGLCGGILIYAAVYCGVCWRYSLNEYEKNLFLTPILKIKTKLSKTGESL